MSENVRVLVVEDDAETADMLVELFRDEGYEVDLARDGQRGLHLGLARRHDVLVVDRALPVVEGADLIARLRRAGVCTRALMLTAYGEVADRIEGLDAGADDYLVKPFDIGELLARVRALHRRHLDAADTMPLDGAELDLDRHEVVLPGGRAVPLTAREFALLRMLAAAPRTVFPREELRARVFADTSAQSAVDTYVYYVRRKLGKDAIRTVHGLGYRFGAIRPRAAAREPTPNPLNPLNQPDATGPDDGLDRLDGVR